MTEDAEWYKAQSEYNRRVYERLVADYDDMADWKVVALFYSALHRVNYWFVVRTGRAPDNHTKRNRSVRREMQEVFVDYRDLYMDSVRARYRDGFRVSDDRRKEAHARLCRIEEKLPF